jgi:hypothetical protein
VRFCVPSISETTRTHIQANDLREDNKLLTVENRSLKQERRASAWAAANVQKSKRVLQEEHASLKLTLQDEKQTRLLESESLITARSCYSLSAAKVNERPHT